MLMFSPAKSELWSSVKPSLSPRDEFVVDEFEVTVDDVLTMVFVAVLLEVVAVLPRGR